MPWDRPEVRWEEFDLVVVRSTWDYHRRVDEFLQMLSAAEAAGVQIENPPALIRWNLEKSYLRELARWGVATVPTLWLDRLVDGDLRRIVADLGSPGVVIKPQVGASAEGAVWLSGASTGQRSAEVEDSFADRALLAQPFVEGILEEGESSLFYFGGRFSHAIAKTPAAGDFRVQEEHGGTVRSLQPEPGLRSAGRAVLEALGTTPLYARIDFVRADDEAAFWLMELELIEPSLYLRMDEKAPSRFAEAIAERRRE